jgi:RNA polymerase subunit RPABC4/transcription elongation factor Spt4
MRKVTCPACRKEHQINVNHCPHCQTTVADELKDVRGEIIVQDEEQRIARKERNTKRWKWGLGIFAGLAVLGQVLPKEADKGYTVPSTVETASEISKRLEDAVPTSIEEAREMAYDDARINWSENLAGPPSYAKVALAIQMVDDEARIDPNLADPKLRLATYKTTVTLIHCNNPAPCGYK